MAAPAVMQPYHVAQYDHRAFDTLMDVDESAYYFESLTGYEHLRSGLRDIFMRHGVDDKLAVALLHRHFELASNEKLVELGPVSSPWPIASHDDSVLGGSILPHTWRVFENELHPLEFRFVAKHELQDAKQVQFTRAFFEDFRQYVTANGLEGVIGITQINHGDDDGESDVQLMEVTHGRSSVMVPAIPTSEAPGPFFQTVWSFVEKQTSKPDTDGFKARHGICYKAQSTDVSAPSPADSLSDGVQARHGICYKAQSADASAPSPADSLSDGVQTRHGICYKAQSTDSPSPADTLSDGVKARHGICYKANSKEASNNGSIDTLKDGIQTRHGICYKAQSADASNNGSFNTLDDGIQTRHGICYKANSKDASNKGSIDTLKDGIQTRHGICYKSMPIGV
ncbi:uncharacterized protein BO87DRAFT_433306 [Aspergillus neoniger CBS 115656]|uniref:Uncharacterized protein n=1 Tax=Aspergillus neoniger (strain CBS 115656) TaxID=1448310 RepID=A0A318ZHV8_ASPNB|nr:hypothetical protein BO87DRAFT_433306 [Aspergillus neoniger CBS 115656]PYH35602.1 hypothetical protein BO87DRAFT_433306 [Aspergillus neoniger CBS 115656]